MHLFPLTVVLCLFFVSSHCTFFSASPEQIFRSLSARQKQRSESPCPAFLHRVPYVKDSVDFGALDKLMQSTFTRGGVVFGLYSVLDGKFVHTGTAGYADEDKKVSWTPDTLTRIGSVTKVFPTLMAFQMAERAVIQLDDPLSSIVPFYVGGGDASQVTFRAMLGQVSGLQRESPLGNTDPTITLRKVLESMKDMRLLYRSYQRPSYSNLAFALVGRSLEHLANATFENYCLANIFTPLQMSNTGFNCTPDVVSRMAFGYGAKGPGARPGDILTFTAPAGQAYSTLNDLGKLLQSLLNEDATDILPPRRKSELLRPMFLNPDLISGFGTPWEVQIFTVPSYGGVVVPTKGGNLNGYSSLIALIPDLGFGFVSLWNSNVAEGNLSRKILDLLLPQLLNATLTHQPLPPAVPPFLMSALTGIYKYPALNLFANVTADASGQQLSIILLAPNTPVFPLEYIPDSNPLAFRIPVNGFAPTQNLGCQAQDETALEGEFVYFEQNSDKYVFTIPGYFTDQVGFVQQ